jgi:nitrogen regulatory protein P-II 2
MVDQVRSAPTSQVRGSIASMTSRISCQTPPVAVKARPKISSRLLSNPEHRSTQVFIRDGHPSNRAQILSCVGFLIAVLEDKGSVMKLVIAIIKPFRLQDVRDALTAIGVGGMTITEVNGYGRQKGHTEIYRGAEYVVRFLPKIRVEIAVSAQQADRVVEAITEAAKTGEIGDGKIFVATIDKAVRIRTGETDSDAL